MSKRKLLFLSDSVSASSGLGRITRDLALRVHQNLGDLYDVATVGYGGNGTRSLPVQQYFLHDIKNWLVPELPAVWADFVGEDEGILMSVWDMSRLFWLGNPQTCPMPHLRGWIEEARRTGKVKLWAYHAIDAGGPNDRVSSRILDTMKGFDRVLDYSAFSCGVTGNTEYIPHGIDTSVFYPRDHKEARAEFAKNGFRGLKDTSLLVGIVATNQTRKNWQLGMETCRVLLDRGHDVRLWAHTDVLERYWSLPNLIADYGLQERVAVTVSRFSDDQLAWLYSACDITLSIAPEGFGYSSAESLACGIPTVAGSYGAQAEYVPFEMQVDPVAFYYEGAFCSKRPAHNAARWADRVEELVPYCSAHAGGGEDMGCTCGLSLLPGSIDWNLLWPAWEKWFREDIK